MNPYAIKTINYFGPESLHDAAANFIIEHTKTPAPGVYDNLPESQYRAADAAANSDLGYFANGSPAHYYAARLDPERKPEIPTPDQIQGRALHCLILEPDTFSERFVYVPEDAPRRPTDAQRKAKNPGPGTPEAIAFWDAFAEQSRGKELIEKSIVADVQRAANAIRKNPDLAGYLRKGVAESSVFAHDPITGELCKIRRDWSTEIARRRVRIDLKSTKDARPKKFARSAVDYGYFRGSAPDLMLLLAFEKKAPYASRLYEVPESELERGRREYRPLLNTYAECRKNGEWPGYDSRIKKLFYPEYIREEIPENEDDEDGERE
jgi:hypothetical protein